MANEIKVQMTIAASKGNSVLPAHGSRKQYDQTTPGTAKLSVDTTVAGVDVAFPAHMTVGFMKLINTDDAINVQWGHWNGATFFPIGLLRAGREGLFEVDPALALRLKAASGTPVVEVILINQ
jgi:hypothetical protein